MIMKIEVKKVDAVKRELKFEVPKDRVARTFDEVYADIGKVAKVKGFRQGKVPRNVLEAHHAKLAREEVIKKLVPEAYQEGIKSENILPIDMPEILDVNLKDGILTFMAKLDIKPDVKIKDYKGISVKRKPTEVTDEEINKTLEYMKQGQGADKNKEVKFDDEFAKGLGYPSLDEFKKSLAKQMELDKDRQNRVDLENQVIGHLLKKAKLAAPESLVRRQMERRIEESKNHWKSHHMSDEDIEKRVEEMKKGLKEAVEKDVKVYLILDKIAELEGIAVKEGDNLPAKVMEFLLKEARWS